MKMYDSERRFATLLNRRGKSWVFHPRRFPLKSGTYQPDFYIPEQDLYIEVVGSLASYYCNRKKYLEFRRLYPQLNFIILDCYGEPFYLPRKGKKIKYVEEVNLSDIKVIRRSKNR